MIDDWMVRTVIYILSFFGLSLFLTIYAFKKDIIGKEGKLNMVEYKNVKPKVEFVARSVLLTIGICLFFATIPELSKDALYLFKGNHPIQVIGEVTSQDDSQDMPFIEQHVFINNDQSKSYRLLYSFFIMNEGDIVDLKVLPNSHMIVSASFFKGNL